MKVSKHCYPGSEGKYRCVKKKKKKRLIAKAGLLILELWFLFHLLTIHSLLQKQVAIFFFFFCIMRAILEQVNSIHLFGEFVLKMWVQ